MFTYFIQKSFRSFIRQKPFFYFNLLGFSVGIACSLLLILFVRDELSYDRFHKNGDQIYRLLCSIPKENIEAPIHSSLLLPLLRQNIPEIRQSAQILNWGDVVLNVNDNSYSEDGIYANADFFDVFSFKISSGNTEKLNEPNNIFISEDLAIKYFGTINVIGKTIKYNNNSDLAVSGIFPSIPSHSHIQFDFIISFKTLFQKNKESWGNQGENIYMVLNKGTDIKALNKKIESVFYANKPEDYFDLGYRLQPLKDIYLLSTTISWDDNIKKGDIKTVIGFLFMSILILIITSFNYLNLKMAQYFEKSRNIGIRKTLGASTLQLSVQFYAETFIYILIGITIATILTEIALPWFNATTGKNLNLEYFTINSTLLLVITFFVFIFLIVAVFPTLFLTKFKPLISINRFYQEGSIFGKSNRMFRTGKIFVFAQYIISLLFAISSITIYRQMKLVTEKKLGYDKEHVVIINNPWDDHLIQRYGQLKDRISRISYIKQISAARNVPTQKINNYAMVYVHADEKNKIHAGRIGIDFNNFKLLNTTVLQGRSFNPLLSADSSGNCIINQELAHELGIDKLDDNSSIYINENKFQLIGIVDDMQFTSLKEPIVPTFYTISNRGLTNIMVKIQGGNILNLKDDLSKIWKDISPEWPLEFSFLDENVDRMYQSELRSLKLFSTFTVIAILLSCMGIYGLSAYSIQNRIKEVGIRKVFGASVPEILKILSWSYLIIVGISFLIASPMAMVTMNNWLKNYVYKIDLTWWTFLLPGFLVFMITLLTISWQVLKASLRNPVEVLRYE